ncbi:hypothetical protein [Actinomycetospora lemnae]|uniref:MBL fold metallo-hydrolase n=1 Tax=Actinomycetospora lemnae TaxID=3019891 RepID=A0ABT5T0C0_9PSEU|nr:hypothetical protein [Actinomycetospora sp. DW7H6]MDD7967667.1 hypothetical protein [Actinomycetospora sp. DW7H6]
MTEIHTPARTGLGDVVAVDERTRLVLGQELDVAYEQPDVGHALVHRAGDTLVLVDTGAGHEPVDPHRFVDDLTRRIGEIGGGGSNPNPVFTGMMAVDLPAEIGLRPAHGDDARPWSRPAPEDPAPVGGLPRGIALLAAVAAMAGWKLRGRDR